MDDLKPTPDHLQQSLSQLHHLLVGTPRVGDTSKRLLREVLGDIERLLDQAPSLAAAAAPATALPRLEALAVEFEADHPALSAGLHEFIDLLGRAGL